MTTSPISPVTGRYVDVKVDGDVYSVFYLENGSGIPLLCQHTAGAHNHQYRNLLRDPEVTKKYRVIAYDLPYHGKSDPPAGRAYWREEYKLTGDFFTKFIVAFAKALELDRPVFMGSSLGGVVCLHLLRDYAEAFRAFIALEATDYAPGLYIKWWSHPEVEGRDLASSVTDGLVAPQTSDLDRRLSMWYFAQCAPGVFKGDLNFYSVEHNMLETAGQLDATRTPLYLLNGEYDYASPPARAQAMGAKIKGARMQTMQGLGHLPMSEDHQRFMTYLRPILKEIAG